MRIQIYLEKDSRVLNIYGLQCTRAGIAKQHRGEQECRFLHQD
jgi:hypothetical protein